jgi:phospholipid/cholesterol/gamma-HCH transport system substrate-binding protein
MKPVAARLDKVLAAADQTIKAIDPKQIKAITGNIAGASERINRFAGTGLREYEQLAVDGRKAIGTFDRTLRSVEKDPSQFIFGPSQSVPEYQGR